MTKERAFPQHPEPHDMEDRSKRLLEQQAPPSWMIRPVTERDVGVDGEIEVRTNACYTGAFFKYQLKSTKELAWRSDSDARSNSINVSTANYWLGLEVPVFLFQADLDEGKIYFQAVGPQLRQRFAELQQQATFSMVLERRLSLDGVGALRDFDLAYGWERSLPNVIRLAERLLFSLEEDAKFLEYSQGRDFHMEADERLSGRIQVLYELHSDLSGLLGCGSLEPYDEFVQRAEAELGADGGLHEYTVTKLCRAIEIRLAKHTELLISLLAFRERSYWSEKKPALVSQCDSLKEFLEWFQTRITIDSVGYRRRVHGEYDQK